ncbi:MULTISPECIES: type II toxin-antitoxin system VapC family toxin [unclassified Endozoicomonas]|uniref:type II toxin-antitoxin system VapC family toxin n=1 Tax=unclassified Endozoicomonas TaxID=2644528 RepID=UPI0021494644|nr:MULTISPECIES: type II toxin-antitoxin system VapC family toxin [unclassified Endozoicomonas]
MMTDFVLDNSVTMRWLLKTEDAADQQYAEDVMATLVSVDAIVPNLWHLEVCNVVSRSEHRGDVEIALSEGFLAQLENLPIFADPLTANQAFSRTLGLARNYNLSSYDAAYLELAIREGLPLATLDDALANAAKKASVKLYLKS